ncbi:hypothetical protein [Cedecea neteri]|uniref:primase 1D-like protein n=1 Tax=Cedecea neteri TaxID=158822 RepID=UPI0006904A75|nr:hypothetical protein [Cedecea neteri]
MVMNIIKTPINDILAISRIDPLLNNPNDRVSFFLSKYTDTPGSNGKRIVIELPKENLTPITFERIIKELSRDEELSILSLIKINDVVHHLPMIDFLAKKRSTSSVDALRKTSAYWNIVFNVFNSGRSIHAYGTKILTQNQWVNFMGYLLLLNEKSKEKVIDVRWVGHRLMAGYSSLRITNNTGKFKSIPSYIGSSTGDILI